MSDDFLEAVNKTGLSVRAAADAAQVAGWVSTGNYVLNWAISGRVSRGWPLGHVAEIFGDSSTGKSLLIARAIAALQERGGLAVLDDTEGALNPEFASRNLGVDTRSLIYRRSMTVKEHFELVSGVLDAWDDKGDGRPLIIALDSLALLSTEHELEVGLDKPSLTRAKEIRAMFRQLGKRLHDRPVLYLIANHKIANVGASPWESKSTTPGGGGPKYESSVRLDMRTPSKLKGDAGYAGAKVRAVVDKNRISAPWREAEVVIPFNRPVDPYSGLIPLLVELGLAVIEKGTWTVVWQGEDTGIKAHKSDILKQDASARELHEAFPDLLDVVDAHLAEQEDFGA